MKLSKLGSLGSRHRVALAITAAAVFAVTLGSSSAAQAQYGRRGYYAPPAPGYYPAQSYRSGLVVGVGVGFGGLSVDPCQGDCGVGLSLEGHLGGMVGPNLALMFDAWAVIHHNNTFDDTTTSGIYTGALQLWLTPILWVKGGAGLGNASTSNIVGDTRSASAFALMGGVGVELVHSGPFALDLQGRIGHSFFTNDDGGPITNYAFMVGFNWY